MKKVHIVKTSRLTISPISDDDMKRLIEEEQDIEMKQAYSEMLEGCVTKPEQRIWYAVWVMQLTVNPNEIVGDLAFKGIDENGMVEIGYGINRKYEGQGFMTEAVTAMAEWASKQLGVNHIEAETEETNLASQRVLEKAGFVRNGVIGAEGPRYEWKK